MTTQGASKIIAKSSHKSTAHDERLACLGVDGYAGKKRDKMLERFARELSFSEGSIGGQGQNGQFSLCENIMEMIPT